MKQQDKLSEYASSGLRVPKLLFLITRSFGLQNVPPPRKFLCPNQNFCPLFPSQTHYSGVGPEKNDMKTVKIRKLSKRKENSKTIFTKIDSRNNQFNSVIFFR